MGSPKNLPQNGNTQNSTSDDRVIWEDGMWAIIEAGDCWDGLARSKTRDTLGDAVSTSTWDPGLVHRPGPKAIAQNALVKVKLADLLANPNKIAAKRLDPKAFLPPSIAPPSPFLPKPWTGKDIPEFPHVCTVCGGRYYRGLDKTIHESTESTHLRGACPGRQKPQIRIS